MSHPGHIYDRDPLQSTMIPRAGGNQFQDIAANKGYDFYKENPGMRAIQAAQGEPGQGSSMFPGMDFGGNPALRRLAEYLQAGRQGGGPPGIPKATKFGFDLPTLSAIGTGIGGIGKFMGGMADWRLAGVAQDKFKSDEAQVQRNILLDREKRFGDVIMANNPIRMQRAFQPTQGYSPDQLSQLVPQTSVS